MKRYLKIPLIIIGSITALYLCFVIYVKIHNRNPLYMDYRYNKVIIEPLAKMGLSDYQFKMGLHYLYGWAIIPPEKDLEKAVYWFEKAIESGHEKAKDELQVAQNPENHPLNFL